MIAFIAGSSPQKPPAALCLLSARFSGSLLHPVCMMWADVSALTSNPTEPLQ